MKHTALYLLLLVAMQLPAQGLVEVAGRVQDADRQPVPFAHVLLGNGFAVTDVEGYFTLVIHETYLADTLKVTAVGFAAYSQVLDNKAPTKLKITLQTEVYTLCGVTINNQRAQAHWLKALKQLRTALPNTAYTYPAYYRQVHQENGSYVRLIEAGMTVYDVAATYQSGVMQERFSLQQVRRSNVTERNGDEHGDHLVDMFLENMVRYPVGTIMDAKVVPQFELRFNDSECTICGDSLEMLSYTYQHPTDPKLLKGNIWLYKQSLKLLALEETATHNPGYRQGGFSFSGGGGHHWMFQESHKTLSYQYIGGKVYLSQLHFEYLHHIHDRTVGLLRYEVAESFSFFCEVPTVQPYGFVPDHTFARKSNLYSRKYRYEPAFWEQFGLVKQHPLPDSTIQTFSGKVPLQQQFKLNGD